MQGTSESLIIKLSPTRSSPSKLEDSPTTCTDDDWGYADDSDILWAGNAGDDDQRDSCIIEC